MSFRSIVRELRDGMSISRSRSHSCSAGAGEDLGRSAPEPALLKLEEEPNQPRRQGRWAELPPELMQEVIERVEGSEAAWPARRDVVACASVCKSWREVTKEIVRTPEECAKITFPISLKQPGPRENPIQCFIRRDRSTGTYYLYLGLSRGDRGCSGDGTWLGGSCPAPRLYGKALQGENGKLLLAARKTKHATSTEYLISLDSDDFSRSSTAYIGKLRSNFLGTKFTVYDSHPPCDAPILSSSRSSRRLHCRQVSPRVPSGNYHTATVSYEFNVLRTRGPRRMLCTMHSIPSSAVKEGGTAPTPISFLPSLDEQFSPFSSPNPEDPMAQLSSMQVPNTVEPLVLKNKAPRWHEQLHCWCLNFKGRVTVASVKNFQLVAAVDPPEQGSSPEQDPVILQFGKIGKDIFTMDYRYPLSALQAFAICLSSFDTKPACE